MNSTPAIVDPKGSAARRILLVEDTMLVAEEIKRMLGRAGCHVVGPISTLDQALRAARDEEIDGALIDINLHDRPAYPVADILLDRGVPFAFLTGYSAASLPEKYRGLPCLEKPFLYEEFLATLQRVLGQSATEPKR